MEDTLQESGGEFVSSDFDAVRHTTKVQPLNDLPGVVGHKTHDWRFEACQGARLEKAA